MTPFEQRFADTPHREIPITWRGQILTTAVQARRHIALVILHFVIRIFSWPHPLAWGAIAASWVAIIALNFSGPRGEALYAVVPKQYKIQLPNAREYFAQRELQRNLLATLTVDEFESHTTYYLRPQDL